MRLPTTLGVIAAMAAGTVWAQPAQETSGARELFYAAVTARDKLPPLRTAVAKKAAPAGKTAPAAGTPVAPSVNLGLRYNLVLVNPTTSRSQMVDPDRIFRKGECFALELEANRSGYLYVLSKQSSGNWTPLLPSPEMADESNVINPGEKVRVPEKYCFEITDPPGTETLFVMLARDPGDVTSLHEGIKGGSGSGGEIAPRAGSGAVQVADARLVNREVQRMSAEYATRDLVIRKVAQPMSAAEPANSVYVVNASSKPATKVITTIKVNHR